METGGTRSEKKKLQIKSAIFLPEVQFLAFEIAIPFPENGSLRTQRRIFCAVFAVGLDLTC
jgi:hypothetical protein